MFIWILLLLIYLKPVRNSSARFGSILAIKDGALNVRCILRMRFCASYISSFKTLFSILGYVMLRCVEFWMEMGQCGCSETPASHPMGTRDSFPVVKAAEG
jgi:hypothetical protein